MYARIVQLACYSVGLLADQWCSVLLSGVQWCSVVFSGAPCCSVLLSVPQWCSVVRCAAQWWCYMVVLHGAPWGKSFIFINPESITNIFNLISIDGYLSSTSNITL